MAAPKTKGRKEMAAPLQMGSAVFLLAAKFICAPGVIKAEQNDTLTKDKIPRLEPENIRESALDFTAHFGEINPDMPYLCRRGLSGSERPFLPFSPLFGGSR